MKLSDFVCKKSTPETKPYKLFDGGGLYLHITPKGGKLWRLRYRYNNKEKLLALGSYPLISLSEARKKAFEAKEQLEQNVDPLASRQEAKRKAVLEAVSTFKAVALEWYELHAHEWSKKHAENVLLRLENNIFPHFGNRPISTLEAPDLLLALKKIEQRDALYTVGRVRQICGQIFRYGIQTGKCKHNPAPHLYGAFKTRKTKHFDAIEPHELPELLKAIADDTKLYPRTIRAIRLSLLTFVRPNELRKAVWSEINFERNEWRIPAVRMKSRKDHIVPLSTQAVAILKEQQQETGHYNTPYIFPGFFQPRKHMSDNTVRVALHNLGFRNRMTPHGFRALARTTIREELEYEPDVIEAQLAHKPSGPLGAAYDRSKFIKQRVRMMQDWADYLDRVCIKSG